MPPRSGPLHGPFHQNALCGDGPQQPPVTNMASSVHRWPGKSFMDCAAPGANRTALNLLLITCKSFPIKLCPCCTINHELRPQPGVCGLTTSCSYPSGFGLCLGELRGLYLVPGCAGVCVHGPHSCRLREALGPCGPQSGPEPSLTFSSPRVFMFLSMPHNLACIF